MITKFKKIKNMAVFENFEWDSSVKAKNGRVIELKKINVFYGRNYSGKTTLSRIVRSLETGSVSDKYIGHEFDVLFNNGQCLTQQNLTTHGKDIRVFNEDFVRDNLRFIFNPEDDIESFAILGSDNNLIESQISKLSDELGLFDEGNESGLYLELKNIKSEFSSAYASHDTVSKALEEKFKIKALDRNIGIKYKPEKFGDQNYTTGKLFNEVDQVLGNTYVFPTEEEIKKLNELLEEKTKKSILKMNAPKFNFLTYSVKAKELVEKKIADSDKIEELVKNAILNRWVSEGRKLHNKVDNCAFCGNIISAKRWELLEKHFDEESQQLERNIDVLIGDLENEKKIMSTLDTPDLNNFYSEFKTEIEAQKGSHKEALRKYTTSINNIISQLKSRKESIIHSQIFKEENDHSEELVAIYNVFEEIRTKSENYTTQIEEKQNKARIALRLKEVYDFAMTIDYQKEKLRIGNLHSVMQEKEKLQNIVNESIKLKLKEIEEKKRLLNDEEEGAKKVNDYLKNFFGHQFLSLESITVENDDSSQD